jgi:hypothetical protein
MTINVQCPHRLSERCGVEGCCSLQNTTTTMPSLRPVEDTASDRALCLLLEQAITHHSVLSAGLACPAIAPSGWAGQ